MDSVFRPGEVSVLVFRYLAASGFEKTAVQLMQEMPFLAYYFQPKPPHMTETEYIKSLATPSMLVAELNDILDDYGRSKIKAKKIIKNHVETLQESDSHFALNESLLRQICLIETELLKNDQSNPKSKPCTLRDQSNQTDEIIQTSCSKCNRLFSDAEKICDKTSQTDPIIQSNSSVSTWVQTDPKEAGEEFDVPYLFYNTLLNNSEFQEKIATTINEELAIPMVHVQEPDSVVKNACSKTENEIDKFLQELLKDSDLSQCEVNSNGAESNTLNTPQQSLEYCSNYDEKSSGNPNLSIQVVQNSETEIVATPFLVTANARADATTDIAKESVQPAHPKADIQQNLSEKQPLPTPAVCMILSQDEKTTATEPQSPETRIRRIKPIPVVEEQKMEKINEQFGQKFSENGRVYYEKNGYKMQRRSRKIGPQTQTQNLNHHKGTKEKVSSKETTSRKRGTAMSSSETSDHGKSSLQNSTSSCSSDMKKSDLQMEYKTPDSDAISSVNHSKASLQCLPNCISTATVLQGIQTIETSDVSVPCISFVEVEKETLTSPRLESYRAPLKPTASSVSPLLQRLIASAEKIATMSNVAKKKTVKKSFSTPRKKKFVRNLTFNTPPSLKKITEESGFKTSFSKSLISPQLNNSRLNESSNFKAKNANNATVKNSKKRLNWECSADEQAPNCKKSKIESPRMNISNTKNMEMGPLEKSVSIGHQACISSEAEGVSKSKSDSLQLKNETKKNKKASENVTGKKAVDIEEDTKSECTKISAVNSNANLDKLKLDKKTQLNASSNGLKTFMKEFNALLSSDDSSYSEANSSSSSLSASSSASSSMCENLCCTVSKTDAPGKEKGIIKATDVSNNGDIKPSSSACAKSKQDMSIKKKKTLENLLAALEPAQYTNPSNASTPKGPTCSNGRVSTPSRIVINPNTTTGQVLLSTNVEHPVESSTSFTKRLSNSDDESLSTSLDKRESSSSWESKIPFCIVEVAGFPTPEKIAFNENFSIPPTPRALLCDNESESSCSNNIADGFFQKIGDLHTPMKVYPPTPGRDFLSVTNMSFGSKSPTANQLKLVETKTLIGTCKASVQKQAKPYDTSIHSIAKNSPSHSIVDETKCGNTSNKVEVLTQPVQSLPSKNEGSDNTAAESSDTVLKNKADCKKKVSSPLSMRRKSEERIKETTKPLKISLPVKKTKCEGNSRNIIEGSKNSVTNSTLEDVNCSTPSKVSGMPKKLTFSEQETLLGLLQIGQASQEASPSESNEVIGGLEFTQFQLQNLVKNVDIKSFLDQVHKEDITKS